MKDSGAAAKVMIIGLDSAKPSLVLERWRDDLPALAGLMGGARTAADVGDPADHRARVVLHDGQPDARRLRGLRLPEPLRPPYEGAFVADSTAIREPRLWDLLSDAGSPSIVIGVPGTYPPRPLTGVMVSCFLTPSTESRYTYPARAQGRESRRSSASTCSTARTSAPTTRTTSSKQIYQMTDRRFALAEHLLETRPWQLFAMVEMGVDRIHHGFWKYMDPEHRGHEPGNPFEHAIRDYYVHLDGLIARPARAR